MFKKREEGRNLGEIAEFLEIKAKAAAKKEAAKKETEKYKKLLDESINEDDLKIEISKWVSDHFNTEIPGYALATHVGKFTNPDSKVHIYVEEKERPDGYLTTENTQSKTDIVYTSAGVMTSASLLLYKMNDGLTIFEHILNRDGKADELKTFGFDTENLYQQFMGLKKSTEGYTDKDLRQVYFPIGKGEYHLLTILPSTSESYTLFNKVDIICRNCMDSKQSKSPNYGKDCSDIWDKTVITFGGTKPQNVSGLNKLYHGEAYLLSSMPPVLNKRDLILPKRNFFRESVLYSEYKSFVSRLHALFKINWDNANIRDKRDRIIGGIIDTAMMTAGRIREENPSGWSDDEKYDELPRSQKIWLDNAYESERKDDKWIEAVSKDFTRWIIYIYEKIKGKQKVALGDAETDYFRNAIYDQLREEVRLGL